MAAFIGEALRIEHAINSLFPLGYEAPINDLDMVFEPDLPKSAVEVSGDHLGRATGDLLRRSITLHRTRHSAWGDLTPPTSARSSSP